MKNKYRVITGIIFTLLALVNVYLFFTIDNAITQIVTIFLVLVVGSGAYALIALGCFTNKKVLRIIGSSLGILYCIAVVVINVVNVLYMDIYGDITVVLVWIIQPFIMLIYWIILLLQTLTNKPNVNMTLGIVGACITIGLIVIDVVVYVDVIGIVEDVLLLIGSISYGLYLKSENNLDKLP